MVSLRLELLAFCLSQPVFGFVPPHDYSAVPGPLVHRGKPVFSFNKDYEQGEVGQGPNWIEKSFPVETDESVNTKRVDDYNLGISGEAFQTGPLGKRMYEAIISRTSLEMSDEIREAFTLYAMDFTAKEAARAALSQNGLEMILQEEEEDQGMWGDVEAIRLYDGNTGIAFNTLYDSLEDAARNWTPGQPFDFVARQVPAKMRELSMDELIQALDPDGSLREEAKSVKGEENAAPDEEALLEIFDDDGINSLSDLANDNVRRTEYPPQEATVEGEAFSGGKSKGYNVIKQSDLSKESMNQDGTENDKALMHVMNAFVSHGVLLVDLTDGGSTFNSAEIMAEMWKASERFFAAVEVEGKEEKLPPMATIMETGSKHAKAGYASCDNGSMKFMETRTERKTGALLPEETAGVLGDDGVGALNSAFDLMTKVGKHAIRIAVAASSVEHGAFHEPKDTDDRDQRVRASIAASLLADELVDDGKPRPRTTPIEHDEGTVCMSPQRLCKYKEGNEGATTAAREIFGAHTDSSFVTIIPVAAVSGLEVYDEAAEKWYRPEMKARKHWEEEQKSRGKDPSLLMDDIDGGKEIPWHCRYIAIMPGEYLQLSTCDEVSSTVHRVVAATHGQARLSAPVLLRGRSGTKFLTKRYIGGTLGNPLLTECDGKTMEDIHDLTQPSSFQ